MTGLKKTHYCGDIRIGDVGKTVTVAGWVQRQRDLGALIFIDLRDRSGIVQLAFDEKSEKEVFDKAFSVRSEYVLMAKGIVRERSSKNKDIPTGDIEIEVSDLRILSESETTPFEITDNCQTAELTRLKYRYLDLRRAPLQKNIMMRHKIVKITRDYFDKNGFIEIETPILIKSTPEGARDYLVPSRVHKGKFYALPQSPQLYKELSMVAGFDRYMQMARCFRDEDLRADRQPEFTQIDLEMSFVDMEDVLKIGEGYIQCVFKEALGVDISLPLPRLTYKEAMERYGSDKPDTRYGLEIIDLSETVKDCGFSVFSGAVSAGGSVRCINVKNAYSVLTRKEIDKLTETAKGSGAKGLAYVRMAPDGSFNASFAKFMTEDELKAIFEKADAKPGDVLLIVGDTKNSIVLSVLGQLRQVVAKKIDIIPEGQYNLLWITEFPFFDWDEDLGQFVAMHHPFTAPLDECLDYLETDKAKVRAKAYDLVLNGIELSSGSIRITNPDLQSRIFTLLGLSDEQAHAKFGYLLDAFKYGAPPHGGMGIGLDRLIMQMIGAESLRDVIAYPKVQNASEPMTDCPAAVDEIQLTDLGIQVSENNNK
ncbi:MAG: aspartate--tRNA ligase [Clostridiales bacterium]|nr:aspartate--tRNA ligase [Clostridiales bacterium]